MKFRVALLLFALPMISGCRRAHSTARPNATISTSVSQSKPEDKAESCRKFVQGFYDWYVQNWDTPDDKKTPDEGGTVERALKNYGRNFSVQLATMLKQDEAAQYAAHEIVGLDFDPIVNGQDIDGKFTVPDVSMNNDHCFANVYETPEGNQQPATPTVVPELTVSGNTWIFVNFHFPAEDKYPAYDLIQFLQMLKQDRDHPQKSSNQ